MSSRSSDTDRELRECCGDDARATNPPASVEKKGHGRQSLHRTRLDLQRLAAANRRKATHPERVVWSLLRKSQLGGLKFRRQAVIGPYIVDFCCPAMKLVIEVDGESHIGRAIADQERTDYLNSRGYRVLRVTNDEVLRDIEAVGLAILKQTGFDIGTLPQHCIPDPPPNPLPGREGE